MHLPASLNICSVALHQQRALRTCRASKEEIHFVLALEFSFLTLALNRCLGWVGKCHAAAARIFPGERLNFNRWKLVSLVGWRAWYSTDRTLSTAQKKVEVDTITLVKSVGNKFTAVLGV